MEILIPVDDPVRLRKSIETLRTYIMKLKEYNQKLHTCEKRQETLKQITSEYETQLRMAHSGGKNGPAFIFAERNRLILTGQK